MFAVPPQPRSPFKMSHNVFVSRVTHSAAVTGRLAVNQSCFQNGEGTGNENTPRRNLATTDSIGCHTRGKYNINTVLFLFDLMNKFIIQSILLCYFDKLLIN